MRNNIRLYRYNFHSGFTYSWNRESNLGVPGYQCVLNFPIFREGKRRPYADLDLEYIGNIVFEIAVPRNSACRHLKKVEEVKARDFYEFRVYLEEFETQKFSLLSLIHISEPTRPY